jgi:hypothetical protein
MSKIHSWPAEAFAAIIIAAIPMNPMHAATPNSMDTDRGATGSNVDRYYWSHRLVGSHVLNMRGQNIGRVNALIVNERGTLTKMLVALNERFDMDGTPVPVEAHRAEIVSARNARVTIIRINLTRDEMVRAQLTQLQSRAKPTNGEPAERDAGLPEAQ